MSTYYWDFAVFLGVQEGSIGKTEWTILMLKGFTWGYRKKPQEYSLSWVQFSFSSVDPIFRNRSNNSRKTPIFHIFRIVDSQTLKQRLKQKLRINKNNWQTIFSFTNQ